MNLKPQREGEIDKILERFDKRFFNPSIPSPTELKSFIQKELSSLIREERDKCNCSCSGCSSCVWK